MLKPNIENADILAAIGDCFQSPVERLSPIGSGLIASAFFFKTGGQEYIIRFVTDTMATSFGKDRLISGKLSSSNVPVPKIMHIGMKGGLHYAISRRYPGVTLDSLSNEENRRLIPEVMAKLDGIHHADITDTRGYGVFDPLGVGQFDNWPSALLSVAEEEGPEGFYGKWHRMFDETFIERELFDKVLERMSELLKFCPSERYLIHADYAWANVLAQDGKITAVLDWANAMFGDFLYDVAWLDLGYPDFNYLERFREYYEARNRSIPYYSERVLCYQCYISLDSQKWYGKTGKQDDYRWMRGRILSLMEQGPKG